MYLSRRSVLERFLAQSRGRADSGTEFSEEDFKEIEAATNNSNLLELVAEYVKETETDTLDLGNKQLGIAEVKYVLNILRDSQVTELNLQNNCLTNGMSELAPLLIGTKIKKLNVINCRLTKEDLLQLGEVLEHTQITDLSDSRNGCTNVFSLDEGLKYVSQLKRSKVTTLASDFFTGMPQTDAITSFFRVYLSSSITRLDLYGTNLKTDEVSFILGSLGDSMVTDLGLSSTNISCQDLLFLSSRLVDTKIEKLNINHNRLKDEDLDILMTGISNSKVTDLDMSFCSLSNLRHIFTRLKETKIKTLVLSFNRNLQSEKFIYPSCLRFSSLISLNFSDCKLDDEAGEGLMETLRFSNVTTLNLSWNNIGSLTVKKFTENVKDFKITDLDLAHNPIPLDACFLLGSCFKESKLTRIALNKVTSLCELQTVGLLTFLKLTEGSSIRQVEIRSLFLTFNIVRNTEIGSGPEHEHIPPFITEPKMLANTTFTELHLTAINFCHDAANLVSFLKYSSITHLNLSHNMIGNEGAIALANCLENFPIRRLNLSYNEINSKGAKAVAAKLKDSHLLYLRLNKNKIKNGGLKFLAEHAKDTFISELDVADNPGKKRMLVVKVVWQNKTVVQKLVTIFKRIAPKSVNDEFCFDQSFDNLDIGTFLEKCMWLYKTAIDKPRTIDVLLDEKSISFSREQILSIVLDKFPLQFSQFIAFRVEANLEQQIDILKNAEEMSLTAIVRDLLYNREAYVLDKEKDILHPYVYKLLRKYNQPVCSSVEPRGVEKIMEYFTEHTHIEGAEDVVNLLHGANIS